MTRSPTLPLLLLLALLGLTSLGLSRADPQAPPPPSRCASSTPTSASCRG